MRLWPILTQSLLRVLRFLSYSSYRSHTTALSGAGTAHKIDIAESAINLKAIYSVIVPQSITQKQSIDSAVKYLAKVNDPYSFSGGRKGVSTTGTFTNETDYVTRYNWRYGSTILRPRSN